MRRSRPTSAGWSGWSAAATFKGAATGPPAILRLTTSDSDGKTTGLIPRSYQFGPQNPSAPLWRISGIEWDNAPLRDGDGRRVRQFAVVHLVQHTRLNLLERGVAARDKNKKGKKGKKRARRRRAEWTPKGKR